MACLEAKPGAAANPMSAPHASSPSVLIYKVMGKMFAILSIRGVENVILKCDPNLAQALREQIDSLLEVGLKVLQVDEPALTTKRQSLDDDVNPAGRRLRHLADRRDGADGREVVGCRVVAVGGLQREEEEPVARQRTVYRLNGQRPRDRERLQRKRKDDGLSEGESGKLARIRARGVGRHPQRIV